MRAGDDVSQDEFSSETLARRVPFCAWYHVRHVYAMNSGSRKTSSPACRQRKGSGKEKGHIVGDTTGLLKILFHRQTRQWLGVHCMGESATEIIPIGQAVMALGGTIDSFRDTVFNHPTKAECDKVAAFDGFNRLSALTENSLDYMAKWIDEPGEGLASPRYGGTSHCLAPEARAICWWMPVFSSGAAPASGIFRVCHRQNRLRAIPSMRSVAWAHVSCNTIALREWDVERVALSTDQTPTAGPSAIAREKATSACCPPCATTCFVLWR
jgi:hypothetical protein